jgi:hypothetical protein
MVDGDFLTRPRAVFNPTLRAPSSYSIVALYHDENKGWIYLLEPELD